MKKVYHALTTVLLIVLILAVGALFLPRILGMTPLAVLSGSMEPTYHVGSLIYVAQADPADVQVGDPITFKISDDTMVTHRVVAIDTEAQTFQTKGDANDNVDGGAVAYQNLVGKPVFTIPYMGYVASYANTTTGMIILVTIILVILVLTFLPDLLMKADEKDKNKEEDKKKADFKNKERGKEDERKHKE
ncbi:signal peptidase I [Eubacterium sp. 1001713B170207_170306_E7]|uniref:signal peptidase I n=1 Tax=Eubacterium sp. 1001713B170207_170306_E7 TaxID=2787097 RepID=UPI001898E44D|nr:signal peptidase I [Eubacterium sp. 1001713B170207_170306_E7]